MVADYRDVTPGYFAAVQAPLLQGTGLPEHASSASTRLVVINETMARTSWPGQSPLGRQVKLVAHNQEAPWYTVAGVVGDMLLSGLDQAVRPQVYVDNRQGSNPRMAIVVRVSGDPLALAASARASASAIDPSLPVAQIRTMQQVVEASISNRRFHVLVVSVFAALAAALALVGLYAVVSGSVGERRSEMSVRAALGARPADLVTLVLTDGIQMVAGGIALGLLGAFFLTRFLETLLFGVPARDPATFLFVPLLLLVVALLGCLVPALRVLRTDPAHALRSE